MHTDLNAVQALTLIILALIVHRGGNAGVNFPIYFDSTLVKFDLDIIGGKGPQVDLSRYLNDLVDPQIMQIQRR
jgi:hypothetical protein